MTHLKEIKTQITDDVTVSELLLASLRDVIGEEQGSCQLVKSNRLIHKIFYELKCDNDFKDNPLLSKLTFDESLPTPYSEEIDTALFRIEASHILETNNPSYQGYLLKEENKKYVEEAYDRLQHSSYNINNISHFVQNKIMECHPC